jgi:hypothetical protein
VDYDSAEKLPTLQKYSTASGADAKDLAQIAIRLKQSFGITDEQLPTALNMAIKSGQLGSFELKDQAKWLPQQLAAANALGMRGLEIWLFCSVLTRPLQLLQAPLMRLVTMLLTF